jgi:hypothetical protein
MKQSLLSVYSWYPANEGPLATYSYLLPYYSYLLFLFIIFITFCSLLQYPLAIDILKGHFQQALCSPKQLNYISGSCLAYLSGSS